MESTKLNKSAVVILAALIVCVLTGVVYYFNNKPQFISATKTLTGKPLAAYDDIYPIVVDGSGILHLDKDRFVNAVAYLNEQPSQQAIADLIYLGQQNNITLELSSEQKAAYQKVASKLSTDDIARITEQRDNLFRTYRDIVNGIGQTFAGTGIEIVLHDTRNPIKSIVAIQNTIFGRQLGGPNTNFGVQLIKDYSAVNLRGSSYISYPLAAKDGRAVKSSTVPLFDERYGLIGFICINIDISKVRSADRAAVNSFIQALIRTEEQPHISEMVDNSKREIQTTSYPKD
jgi:predicted transcriptional regulator YheO